MRLAWILLAALVVGCSADNCPAGQVCSSTTEPTTAPATFSTTPEIVDDKTTTAGGSEVPNTASTVSGATEAPVVTETPGPTDESVTDGTEPTGQSPKTTKAVPTTTTTKKAAGTTTTKEPAPNVESFTVTCDKNEPSMCKYTMQVPGLDIDTYNELIKETNDTQSAVDKYEAEDFIDLQEGVTKVFDDAEVTADYVEAQLKEITQQIGDLGSAAITLENDIDDVTTALSNANFSLTKILNKKGSCLYRQCVLKETTTTKQPTTTTVRTTPTPFCQRSDNLEADGNTSSVCMNGGTCNNWYDSYYCNCVGNLDGQDEDCKTSVCDAIKTPQEPGLVVSPGYYNKTNPYADDDCDDGAQWTIKAKDSKNVLTLEETSDKWPSKAEDNDFIGKLSSDSNLQLTVGKYKLKITSKTKYTQITQILGYGATATISYSGPKESYFHFTIKEILPPPTPAPGS